LKSGSVLEPEDVLLQASDLVAGTEEAGAEGLLPYHESVDQHRRRIIRRALDRSGGSRVRAAQLLGLQPTYLSRLLKQLNIS
jgi:DNA-binding NtrC family response regulator